MNNKKNNMMLNSDEFLKSFYNEEKLDYIEEALKNKNITMFTIINTVFFINFKKNINSIIENNIEIEYITNNFINLGLLFLSILKLDTNFRNQRLISFKKEIIKIQKELEKEHNVKNSLNNLNEKQKKSILQHINIFFEIVSIFNIYINKHIVENILIFEIIDEFSKTFNNYSIKKFNTMFFE